jgi:stage III sporulation protein AG
LDKGFIEYFKGRRRTVAVALLVLLGLFLLLLPLMGGRENDGAGDPLLSYKERLESEVSSLAANVRGVGRCRVFITFERGELNTYKNGELIESRPPLVLGVTVVCEGGENGTVRARLTEMLTALFDIPSNRVAVLRSK